VASCGHSLHRDCLRFYGWAVLWFFVLLDLRRQNYTWVPIHLISLKLVVFVDVCFWIFKKDMG
jgi:hypothetical protein